MKPRLGLHTQEEVGKALDMAGAAYNRALDAYYQGKDAVAIAFEIGYIKAISDLAEAEGARGLMSITRENVARLDAYLSELRR